MLTDTDLFEVDLRDKHGRIPLYYALIKNDVNLIKILIEKMIEYNSKEILDKELIMAARK